jgi:hypothetical protein
VRYTKVKKESPSKKKVKKESEEVTETAGEDGLLPAPARPFLFSV